MRARAAAAALVLAGCAADDRLTVDFDRLEVWAVDWSRVSGRFVLHVENPNQVQLNLTGLHYLLAFEGVDWAEETDPEGLAYISADLTELAAPVDVSLSGLFQVVTPAHGQDAVEYDLAGALAYDTPWGDVELPFAASGPFPALRAPAFMLERVRVEEVELGAMTARLAVDLAAENPNGSALGLRDLEYELEIDGYPVGGGVLEEPGAIAGASSATVSLPLDLDLLDLGTAALDVAALLMERNGWVRIGLAGSVQIDTPFSALSLTLDQEERLAIE